MASDLQEKHVMGEGYGTGNELTDLSFGIKYSLPVKEIGLVFANILIPVDNDKETRSDTIYTCGFELSFQGQHRGVL